MGSLGWILASQMLQFLNQLPSYQDNVTHRVEELRASSKNSIIAKVEDFIENVTSAATSPLQESAKESLKRAKQLASKPIGRSGRGGAAANGHRRDAGFVCATRPVGDDRRYAVGIPRFASAW